MQVSDCAHLAGDGKENKSYSGYSRMSQKGLNKKAKLSNLNKDHFCYYI